MGGGDWSGEEIEERRSREEAGRAKKERIRFGVRKRGRCLGLWTFGKTPNDFEVGAKVGGNRFAHVVLPHIHESIHLARHAHSAHGCEQSFTLCLPA